MIDKLSNLKSDLLNHKSFNLVVNEIESQIKDNHYDLIVNEDNFECSFERLKNNNKEITKYIVSFNDSELIFNTYLAIVDNDNNVINSSFLETYNEYGIQITKEYKLYSNKIKTEDYFKRCIEGNNYNYIESIKRQYFDTADIYIENKIENNIYKSKILLKGNNGYQKMEYDLNGYKSQIIPSITKDNIQKLIDLETDDVIKKGLLMLSENRENYEYNSTEDPDYLSKGFAYKPNKSKSMLTKTMIIPIMLFVFIISIAYAAYTGILNINGSGVNRKSNFDIYFNNVSDFQTTGTASVVTPNPKVREHTTIIEDYEATLITPSDSIYFTFDIVNDGDYDATLTNLTLGPVKCSVNGNEEDQSARNVCENIEYTMKYTDNNQNVSTNDKLLSKETKNVKVTLTYKDTITADKLPTSNVSISNLGMELVYEADQTAKTNNDGSTPYEKQYTIGEELTVKNEKYNVIGIGSDYLTLLKQEPLTVEEVNTYGTGHVNMHNNAGETAFNQNGYGGMAYYTSTTCGYVNGSWVEDGCKTNYAESEIKYVVDAWAADKFQNDELKKVDNYKARLVSFDEAHSFGYGDEPQSPCGPSCGVLYYPKTDAVPSWLYNSNYWYWTMSGKEGSSSSVWYVVDDGGLASTNVYNFSLGVVRPVINLYKSKL